MIYPTEEDRDRYHRLKTDVQLAITELEEKVARLGAMMTLYYHDNDSLQIVIGITDECKNGLPTNDFDTY